MILGKNERRKRIVSFLNRGLVQLVAGNLESVVANLETAFCRYVTQLGGGRI
jgi:hypothetical protein